MDWQIAVLLLRQSRIQLAQLRFRIGYRRSVTRLRFISRRSVTRLRFIAGTCGVREGALHGDSLVELKVDLGLELAPPLGQLVGGFKPFLSRTRLGGFEGGIRVHEPAFEGFVLCGRVGKLRR